jgi:hypothetical protein
MVIKMVRLAQRHKGDSQRTARFAERQKTSQQVDSGAIVLSLRQIINMAITHQCVAFATVERTC